MPNAPDLQRLRISTAGAVAPVLTRRTLQRERGRAPDAQGVRHGAAGRTGFDGPLVLNSPAPAENFLNPAGGMLTKCYI
jgi:hypothetical protein